MKKVPCIKITLRAPRKPDVTIFYPRNVIGRILSSWLQFKWIALHAESEVMHVEALDDMPLVAATTESTDPRFII